MTNPHSFRSHTLDSHPQGEAVMRILAAAIQAVEPGAAVRRQVSRVEQTLQIAGHAYDLEQIKNIAVLGLGKAAEAMSASLIQLLSDRAPRGLLIPKHAPACIPPGFEVQIGGHPVPDRNSLCAGAKALELVQALSENDILICLISGGGSALMSAPQPGVSLADLQILTAELLSCGARIDEINILRRHLDQLKGGGLARIAAPARVVSLILSDVVGSALEAIASGPTAPDPSTRQDALAVLEKYHLAGKIPAAIQQALEKAPETPKPGNSIFSRVQNSIAGSNQLAADAALTQACAEGFHTISLGSEWQGEARELGSRFSQMLKNSHMPRPFCMAAGGESTVNLHGHGRGGRNQELALAAVRDLAGQSDTLLISLATDGEDGPSDAAGAVVSGETFQRGLEAGITPEPFLEDNDSYSYFCQLGDLLKPGPTGTNVNDLSFLFGF